MERALGIRSLQVIGFYQSSFKDILLSLDLDKWFCYVKYNSRNPESWTEKRKSFNKILYYSFEKPTLSVVCSFDSCSMNQRIHG
jgi:hypothetical protein